MSNVQCPDCHIEMEIGFIPDMFYGNHARQMVWYTGTPVPKRLFGLKTDGVKSNDSNAKPTPIRAFRCPDCGLLRLHAIPKPESAPSE